MAAILRFPSLDNGIYLNDWFCGAGGAMIGCHFVPGIVPVLAANHNQHGHRHPLGELPRRRALPG
jgi:hypothetical protein